MSSSKPRLLDPALIPAHLWDRAAGSLRLPSALSGVYVALIDRYKLRSLAATRDPKNPAVGGLTQEKTDQHFAQNFDGSAARAQLALLDPDGAVLPTSDVFLASLLGGSLSLVDAPCGAGAAALSFLATIGDLRAASVLPRLPLDVHLIGAEISDPARVYAEVMLDELRTPLEEQAIFVEAEFLDWDVTDALSTARLTNRMAVAANTRGRRLLVVANFNGFLEQQGKRKEAEPQLQQLFMHASAAGSAAVWIEPKMNEATSDGGFFSWLRRMLTRAWRLFARELSNPLAAIPATHARFHLPLDPHSTPARVTLAVMPIDLEAAP